MPAFTPINKAGGNTGFGKITKASHDASSDNTEADNNSDSGDDGGSGGDAGSNNNTEADNNSDSGDDSGPGGDSGSAGGNTGGKSTTATPTTGKARVRPLTARQSIAAARKAAARKPGRKPGSGKAVARQPAEVIDAHSAFTLALNALTSKLGAAAPQNTGVNAPAGNADNAAYGATVFPDPVRCPCPQGIPVKVEGVEGLKAVCNQPDCDFTTNMRQMRDHFLNVHLGTICFWHEEGEVPCKFQASSHQELGEHFRTHMPNDPQVDAKPYACPWPGNPVIHNPYGEDWPAEEKCNHTELETKYSAQRHARSHQYRIWERLLSSYNDHYHLK
ncbi:hypothetical protein F4861DRAFT_288533 [Xylaria intraflava]|nr:hypothetical protein F4861DRAFT_288533 [Xylaria intraflava]